MPPRRVLLVAREFPPSGGAPSIRLTKLIKYLPQFGWSAEVLTMPEDHAWSPDPSLVAELPADLQIHRVPRLLAASLQPADGTVDAAGELRPKRIRRAAGAVLVPDAAVLWALPALRAARRLVRRFDAVLTSAPPFSTHLVGLGVASRLPWVADYRDNWTTNPEFRRHGILQMVNGRIDRTVLRRAGAVTVVSETARGELLELEPRLAGRVFVAMNGFDPDDLPRVEPDREAFRVVYAGSMRQYRDPEPLFRALAHARDEEPALGERLRVELIGRIPASVVARARAILGDAVEAPGFLPHREALLRSARAAILVVLSSIQEAGAAAITSKLAECLALRRPVLFIGPDGPGAALIRDLGAGEVVEPGDWRSLAVTIRRMHGDWLAGRERVASPGALDSFTRVATAEEVAAALETASQQQRS
jgi:glycosyltransferase involved in cell wall biosynthesis